MAIFEEKVVITPNKDGVRHYTAYKPAPFTPEQKDSVTIVFGGLTWKHEKLIQGVLHNLNYKAQPLPNPVRADLDAGKELIDIGACCPTTFVTGNLTNFLKSEMKTIGKDRVVNKYIYLTAGACGACRFGQYHQSYSMALELLGLKDFRVFLMNQDQMDQGTVTGGGLELSMRFSMGVIWALLCGDLITDLEYMTRPYEVTSGQTDQVLAESVEHLYQVFLRRPLVGEKWDSFGWHLLTNYFIKALREVKTKWDGIEINRLQVKPKVKITGEFWLQTHEGDGNYNVKNWLETEGAEVLVPPIAVWLDYWMRFYVQEFQDQRKTDPYACLKICAVRTLQWMFQWTYNRLRKALGFLPHGLPNQYELQRLAKPFYDNRLSGGEGDMLIGKALHSHKYKTAHMICELTPYSCLPNTMSIGAMANVLGKYPQLLYAPIEVKGDAEIHALSRCQMVLTEAKNRAQREFEKAINKTATTMKQIRKQETLMPFLKNATYRVPHYGMVGTAANYVVDVNQKQ